MLGARVLPRAGVPPAEVLGLAPALRLDGRAPPVALRAVLVALALERGRNRGHPPKKNRVVTI